MSGPCNENFADGWQVLHLGDARQDRPGDREGEARRLTVCKWLEGGVHCKTHPEPAGFCTYHREEMDRLRKAAG